VNGQGVIGPGCAWCGLPAVGEVEVQPALYRSVTRRDPLTGERTSHQLVTRAAIVAAVGDEHRHITARQLPPVGVRRQRSARGVEQLGLFADGREERLCNAIYGETGR